MPVAVKNNNKAPLVGNQGQTSISHILSRKSEKCFSVRVFVFRYLFAYNEDDEQRGR
jgi:hypothetical protein